MSWGSIQFFYNILCLYLIYSWSWTCDLNSFDSYLFRFAYVYTFGYCHLPLDSIFFLCCCWFQWRKHSRQTAVPSTTLTSKNVKWRANVTVIVIKLCFHWGGDSTEKGNKITVPLHKWIKHQVVLKSCWMYFCGCNMNEWLLHFLNVYFLKKNYCKSPWVDCSRCAGYKFPNK